MDWGEDEEEKVAPSPRDIWDEDKKIPLKREKSKLSEAESPKSALMGKFADVLAKPPTPTSPKVRMRAE